MNVSRSTPVSSCSVRTRSSAVAAVIAALSAAVPGAFGQAGDRPNEVQTPVPSHIVTPPAPALSPEEALKTFTVAPGFRIELVAAEPLVRDPVVIQFAPDGKLWVVEMSGYMPNVDGIGEDQPVGTIATLEDTDGDGRMDKRTNFADGLVMPRAISFVDDGVLVAAPLMLWCMKDTNGDGVADQKTEISTAYGNTSGPEHNANGLMWAMDNWIYSANHTVRYRYEGDGKFTGEETITRGQWGITQDNVGRLFYNSNSDPLRVDFIPGNYLNRNPVYRTAGTAAFLAPSTLPIWPGRVTPGINRGYQLLQPDGRYNQVTSAGGPVIYRGDLFPAEFQGNAFIAEPTGFLVKRILLEERDGGLSGRNAYEGTEFLLSTDERFRPVNLANGPDGALYIADMYRGIIQHRVYVTTFLRNQIIERKLENPVNLGRIYRIVPEGSARPQPRTLAGASTADLVAALADANGWRRDTAQRLLVEKRTTAAVPALKALAFSSPHALARLHALWTLDGLDALDADTALKALSDSDPRVMAAAIRLSERHLADASSPHLQRVLELAKSIQPAIRLQVALSLGESQDPAAVAALWAFARASGNQPFLIDAVVNSMTGREDQLIAAAVAEGNNPGPTAASAVTLATTAVLRSNDNRRDDALLNSALAASAPTWVKTATLDGLDGLMPPAGGGRGGRGGPGGGGGGGAGGRGGPGGGRGGQQAGVMLPGEPTALMTLAAESTNPLANRATDLLGRLRWPGKAGMITETVVALSADQQRLFEIGREHYATLCAACHLPTGQGQAGVAATLVGARWATGDDRVLARLVLEGKLRENLLMPPMRDIFDDQTMAGILTYIRRSWGNNSSPVSPAVVAEARAAAGNSQQPLTEAELEKLLQELPARTTSN
jgi:glucose/arabinose dehydrogenase/mono/diheme cytochrome c family protein